MLFNTLLLITSLSFANTPATTPAPKVAKDIGRDINTCNACPTTKVLNCVNQAEGVIAGSAIFLKTEIIDCNGGVVYTGYTQFPYQSDCLDKL